ncbi:stage III sporulation protein AA [Paenibacillus sp. UMB4589-SE434]|uniref:stage III sporulation protein AA n=1 Tax=Paenibacillus sp. UMB4589-SE434 TaxID=3046314 RepID=UPI00254F4E1D|nr:stage III sporulation protein AA [Paenibacillus sp. UMB4589-SE434]MDK8179331.1 stage III sporulation protein AA [Paenibacillus sp. UMB4589-SE434]
MTAQDRTSWSLVLPPELRSLIMQLPSRLLNVMEEIRIREGRPLEVSTCGEYHFITNLGTITEQPLEAHTPSREDCHRLLDLLTNHSLYTMEEQLRRGYVTIAGGHRVGLSGRTVLHQGKVSHLRDISGFNVRIAREVKGTAASIMPYLLDFRAQSVYHTLIVSPPQHGKTTLLRDVARSTASGMWNHPDARWQSLKVGIVDERSEIAGCIKGVPSFDLGFRSDVLDGCPKAEGMMMLIRSMSPDVIVVDEFGREEDVFAMREAIHAGVRVIASAHGSDVEELRRRPGIGELLTEGVFSRIILLKRTKKEWTWKIYDDKRRALLMPEMTAGVKGGGGRV